MRHISDDERRRRLAVRQGLAPDARHRDPVDATAAMSALHATEAASVYLSLVARVVDLDVDAVGRALYEERTLVKQLAMRRTIFVFGRDLLPAAWASAGARTATFERRKIVRDLIASSVTNDGEGWLAEARAAVLGALAQGPLTGRALRERVPMIERTVTLAPGTRWGGEIPLAPRILAWLSARGEVVRGPNDGGWWVSRPTWARMDDWLGSATHSLESPVDEAAGYRELVRRWLTTFGPGTEMDLVWWLGSTKTVVRRALAELAAVEVSLDSGAAGWVLPDDVEPVGDPGSWAALLPSLDPSTMGWKQRDFYLSAEDVPFVIDGAGNAGTTAWLDGRIVGFWLQGDDGTVQVVLRSPVSRRGERLLAEEARRLTAWLAGRVIASVYMARHRRGELVT
jgi:DNA glycosylase AlkZ-like